MRFWSLVDVTTSRPVRRFARGDLMKRTLTKKRVCAACRWWQIAFRDLPPSLDVGEKFGKQHRNVLQATDNVECSEQFRRLNFQPSSYTNQQGRQMPMYRMTPALSPTVPADVADGGGEELDGELSKGTPK